MKVQLRIFLDQRCVFFLPRLFVHRSASLEQRFIGVRMALRGGHEADGTVPVFLVVPVHQLGHRKRLAEAS